MSREICPFDRGELDRFVEDGYLGLRAAIPREIVTQCRDWMWRETGLDLDDPSGWIEPVVRIYGSTAEPFRRAMNCEALYGAFDQLVGTGRWQRPVEGTGTFPIRFPSEQDPGDAGWHIDGSYEVEGQLHVNHRSRSRALLMLILFSDITESDAPTRIRRGSHLLVPPVLQAAGEAGIPFGGVVPRIDGLDRLPIDLATGAAGDVYLCHPFLVHAAGWPHRGTAPRFLSQPGLVPTEPIDLDRADHGYSPVERAMRIALGRSPRT